MSIKRYSANKDNTISSALKNNLSSRAFLSNMGSSDILEIFSIFGQASSSSLEQSRILVNVPVGQISKDRIASFIPESGSINFKFKMYNAAHGQTTPESFSISCHPIIRNWNEGFGLDMEEYRDLGDSNWNSASFGVKWSNTGGDFLQKSILNMANLPIPEFVSQDFDSGAENLEVDITPIVEEWLKDYNEESSAATGSIVFHTHDAPGQNISVPVVTGSEIQIYTHEGDYRIFQFSQDSGSVGKYVLVPTGSLGLTGSIINLCQQINNHLGNAIAATPTSAGDGLPELTASLTQNTRGFNGNTFLSSSIYNSSGQVDPTRVTMFHFSGGLNLPNYGLLMKLSGSAEDGTTSKSYYTKKFFARSSQYFFKRPIIEAQWDPSIKDDRINIIRSSSLAPAEDNLNSIYLYNRRRNKLVDVPNTGSNIVVQFFSEIGSNNPVTLPVEGGVSSHSPTFVTASRVSKGVYRANFACSNTASYLYDVWSREVDGSEAGAIQLFSGSGFSVKDESEYYHYETPSYVTNITNLKSSYDSNEVYTFRVHTKDRTQNKNIYTVASQAAPITTIRDSYYQIARVSDNLIIVPYSTGSTPSFSSLSYDVSGSFFDLDMSILEPNYLYEISFLYKDNTDFVEQKEKFKFRVDP